MARRPTARSSPPPSPPSRPRKEKAKRSRHPQRGSIWKWAVAAGLGVLCLIFLPLLIPEGADRLRSRAEAASRANDLTQALAIWRKLNATSGATATTLLAEGKVCLSLGRAAQAEAALRRVVQADPGQLEAWLLLLEIMRVEDRLLDAFQTGWEAIEHIDPRMRTEILRQLTLTALADVPDDLARGTLRRWIDADSQDLDAKVAYLRRANAEPRADDPGRVARLKQLERLLAEFPENLDVREALATTYADAGEAEPGKPILDGWPAAKRDGRYWRLKGRWELDHEHQPQQAVISLRKALDDFPHDWRTHFRLSRALQITGQPKEAEREAEIVRRIRELLDPLTFNATLDSAFSHLNDPKALETLASHCSRASLHRLAKAWRESPPQEQPSPRSPMNSHAAHGPNEIPYAGFPSISSMGTNHVAPMQPPGK